VVARYPPKPVRCPGCRLRSEFAHVWGYRSCAACGARLRIRRRQFLVLYLLAIVVSVSLAYVTGKRQLPLEALAILLCGPVLFAMVLVSLRLFPLDVVMVAPGWTPSDSEDDQEVARQIETVRRLDPVFGTREPEPLQLTEDESTGRSRLPLSLPSDQPFPFEAVALAFAAAAMLAYLLYVALAAEF
jgi:hypothetical protein